MQGRALVVGLVGHGPTPYFDQKMVLYSHLHSPPLLAQSGPPITRSAHATGGKLYGWIGSTFYSNPDRKKMSAYTYGTHKKTIGLK